MADFTIQMFDDADGGMHWAIYRGGEEGGEEVDGGICTTGKVADALGMAVDQVAAMRGHSGFEDAAPVLSDDPDCCGCDKCGDASRHCPDCDGGGTDAAGNACPMCDGAGSVSRDDNS